jgi:hypothetical protein
MTVGLGSGCGDDRIGAATSSVPAASQPGKEDVAMRRGDVRGARAVAILALLALGSVRRGSGGEPRPPGRWCLAAASALDQSSTFTY